jgi:hypothetical protein
LVRQTADSGGVNQSTSISASGAIAEDLRARNPLWYQTMLGMSAVFIVCSIAGVIDDRTLLDISVWIKPAKFSLSIAVYFATLLWFVPLLPANYFATARGRTINWTAAVCAILEMAYILFQAARAEPSHFNTSSPLYATLYSLMGAGAVLMVTVCLVLAVEIYRIHRLRNPFAFAAALGLFGTFLLGGGFGGYLGSSSTGHWVGAPATDADGLFGFNWTREGGDLRVAHFFGMHAMQVLPLLALVLPASWSALRMNLCIVVAFVFYAALTTATFIQAIEGRPFLG